MATLGLALDEVRENPNWARKLEQTPLAANTQVVAGCPESSVTNVPTPNAFGEYVWNRPGRIVERPSPHVLHVYILPPEEIFRIVGPSGNYHGAEEESLCFGDECYTVTDALYYSPNDLDDLLMVTREMEFTLGLREEPW
jgi:hypothetical protein